MTGESRETFVKFLAPTSKPRCFHQKIHSKLKIMVNLEAMIHLLLTKPYNSPNQELVICLKVMIYTQSKFNDSTCLVNVVTVLKLRLFQILRFPKECFFPLHCCKKFNTLEDTRACHFDPHVLSMTFLVWSRPL